MGTKYSTQAISGYNATPPADDGSAVESNKVKWATHKDKLADPIKTLAEAIDTALVTYVDRQPLTKSTTYTTVVGDHLKIIETTGTTTITLGAVASMGTGYTVTIKNAGTGVVTVDGSGSETIDGILSLTLDPDQAITCVVDSAAGSYISQSGGTHYVQSWDAQQYFPEATLTDQATITWDLSAEQTAKVTLAGNRTLGAPTNQKAGATYVLRIIQDATGSRTLAYNAAYYFPGGIDPTLTTTGNAVDLLSCYSDGTNMNCNLLLDLK